MSDSLPTVTVILIDYLPWGGGPAGGSNHDAYPGPSVLRHVTPWLVGVVGVALPADVPYSRLPCFLFWNTRTSLVCKICPDTRGRTL